MQINNKKVIGIILAYKAAGSLEKLYKSLPMDVLDDVFVSNDETGDGIEQVAQRLGIKCFSHPRLGYGGNMKYGMKKAIELGADYMVEIHGDGQYGVDFIKPAVDKINEGYDLVLGSRFTDILQPLRDEMSLVRYIANIGLTFLQKIVLRVRLSELHTGARVYSSSAISKIDLGSSSDNFLFSFEIIAQFVYKKFRIAEVPVRCYYGKEHSSISLKASTIYAFNTFGVLYNFIISKLGFKTKLFYEKKN